MFDKYRPCCVDVFIFISIEMIKCRIPLIVIIYKAQIKIFILSSWNKHNSLNTSLHIYFKNIIITVSNRAKRVTRRDK